MNISRNAFKVCAALGAVSALAGTAALVYVLAAFATLEDGSRVVAVPMVLSAVLYGLLVVSGSAAAYLALRLGSAEAELSRLRHEREILEAERESQRLRLRGLERRAEGLSLVREIHRCTNIIVRGERLRQLLYVIGRLDEEAEAVLFYKGDAGLKLFPAAYLRVDQSGEVFLKLDGRVEPGARLSVTEATSSSNGFKSVLSGEVLCGSERVGRLEASVASTGRISAEEVLLKLLATVDLDASAALSAVEQGQVLRRVRVGGDPGAGQRGPARLERVYPLAAEGLVVGALRVCLPIREECSQDGIEGIEDILSECARHVALALKKESDADRAETDALTGLLARREFEPRLTEAVGEAIKLSRPLSLLVLDIDHFKRVNDTYGHKAGDVVLRGVAGLLKRHVRACDSAFRYGGEELCIVLPGAGSREAKATAERLRAAVEGAIFSGDAEPRLSVTVSIGVATFDPRRQGRSRSQAALHRAGDAGGLASELFHRADEAVYAAKRTGRNKVVVWKAGLKAEAEVVEGASGVSASAKKTRTCRQKSSGAAHKASERRVA